MGFTPSASASDLRAQEYRIFVGPADFFDLQAATQFNLLTYLGLRENHYLLDIGCGCLRAGRLFLAYLSPGHYFGIEPEEWLINEGIEKELGHSIIEVKRPSFNLNRDFELSIFGRKFDFILAQSIFSHTSAAQIQKCFVEVKSVMQPAALFAASFFEGDENYAGDKWTVKATFTFKRMSELSEVAGLRCERLDWPHVDRQTWVLIVHSNFKPHLAEMSGAARVLQLEADKRNRQRLLHYAQNNRWAKLGYKLKHLKIALEFTLRDLRRKLRFCGRPPVT